MVFRDFDFEEGNAPQADASPNAASDAGNVEDLGSDLDESPVDMGCESCPASIEITPSSVQITVGDLLELEARVLDADGNHLDAAEVIWSSEDETVVSVDDGGVVTAHTEGTTRVFAQSGGLEGSSDIVVFEEVETLLEIVPPGPLALEVRETRQLDAFEVQGSEQTECDASWSSQSNTVAAVSQDGLIEALAVGESTIEAQCGELTRQVDITVSLPASLTDPARLLAWFESSHGISVGVADEVTKWEGKSDNNEILEALSGAALPTLVEDVINGEPVVRFDGIDDALARPGNWTSTRPDWIVDEFTAFFVARNNEASHRGQLLANCTQRGINQQIRYNGASNSIYVYGQFTDVGGTFSLPDPTTNFQILMFRRTSTSFEIYQDGQLAASSPTNDMDDFYFSELGSRCTNEWLDGDIAAFMLFDDAVNETERGIVESHLQVLYGL